MAWSKLFGRGPDLGGVDPDDPEGFCALTEEVNEARRRGAGPLRALFDRHRVRDESHWARIVMAMGARHGSNDAYRRAALRNSLRRR